MLKLMDTTGGKFWEDKQNLVLIKIYTFMRNGGGHLIVSANSWMGLSWELKEYFDD